MQSCYFPPPITHRQMTYGNISIWALIFCSFCVLPVLLLLRGSFSLEMHQPLRSCRSSWSSLVASQPLRFPSFQIIWVFPFKCHFSSPFSYRGRQENCCGGECWRGPSLRLWESVLLWGECWCRAAGWRQEPVFSQISRLVSERAWQDFLPVWQVLLSILNGQIRKVGLEECV